MTMCPAEPLHSLSGYDRPWESFVSWAFVGRVTHSLAVAADNFTHVSLHVREFCCGNGHCSIASIALEMVPLDFFGQNGVNIHFPQHVIHSPWSYLATSLYTQVRQQTHIVQAVFVPSVHAGPVAVVQQVRCYVQIPHGRCARWCLVLVNSRLSVSFTTKALTYSSIGSIISIEYSASAD